MIRFKVLNTPLFFVALLTSFSSLPVGAESKLYRSDTNMPFVKMMLSMMSAMGILDKVSGPGSYGSGGYGSRGYGGGYGPGGFGSRGYGMNRYGLNEFGSAPWGGYANSPFQRSPWLQSPLSQSHWSQSVPGDSPVWGSPDWGVIPTNEYSYGYSPYGYGYTPYGARWSSADLDGWVKEPWESSQWNPDASEQVPVFSQQQAIVPLVQMQPAAATPTVTPIVQNFNYNVSEEVLKNDGQTNHLRSGGRQDAGNQNVAGQSRQSPLAKLQQQPQLQQSRPSSGQPSRRSSQAITKQTQSRQKPKKTYRQEKPCITDFCGLKKPTLNGLWVTQDGEMMGVKNKRYLWSDGKSRHLKGLLKIQNEYLVASVDGHEKVMRFKYKLAGNHLLTMQQDGTIREFMRKPNNPYTGYY